MRTALLLLCILIAPAICSGRTEAELNLTLDTFWKALSNEPGKSADVQTLRSLFHEKAQIAGVRFSKNGSSLLFTTLPQFLEAQAKPSKDGFYEKEIYRKSDLYSTFAHVLCTVESRKNVSDPKPMFTGVNSLQLFWSGEKWLIISLYYHLEDPAIPIPLEFRTK